jgi:hypothetical protein
MQFAHWLIVAGACLVLVGSIGLMFQKSPAEFPGNNLTRTRAAPPDPLRLAGPKAKGNERTD